MSAERLEEVMFSGEPAESCPRVVFSGTASGGAEGGDIMGEACPHKLGSTNHPRLLLYILIPTISLLAALLLLILALTGIFGSGLIDSRIHSSSPYGSVADRNHLNQSLFDNDNDNFTASQGNHSNGDDATPSDSPVTGGLPLDRTTDPTPAASSASPMPATQPYTLAPDLLTSVTSLSTSWPISTSQEPDTGSCQVVLEPQCHMLPYNQTWLSSSVAVVKSSEVDMLLRFFSYLSRLSCYRHIMLFGCSLALPECSPRNQTQERRVVLPCWSFCEAAREGCEPVLQMFNASWPDFLRCSQFQNLSSSSPSPPETSCYSPRQVKGKPSREHRCGDGRCVSNDWLCDGDHDCVDKTDEVNCSCKSQGLLECRNGQCIPSAFRCDGDNDCKDGSDEENCHQTQTDCVPGQSSCISNPCPAQCGANSTTCLSPPTNTSCTQCEPITLELCMNLPYNSTTYPNYLGHMSQRESSVSWEASLFPALVQTGCYQYLMFYACTLLVPKCDPVSAQRIPPCRHDRFTDWLADCLAKERCEAVLGVVGLPWPEGSECNQFPQEGNATCLLPEDGIDECSPSHFKCRSGRCVLATKRCDGHLDCDDHSDEDNCGSGGSAAGGSDAGSGLAGPVLGPWLSGPVLVPRLAGSVLGPRPGLRPGPRLVSPVLGLRLASPRPGPRLVSPVLGPRLVSPVLGPRLVSPVLGPRLVSPVLGPRLVSPVLGPRLVSPVLGPRLVSPVLGPRLAGPVLAPRVRIRIPVLRKWQPVPLVHILRMMTWIGRNRASLRSSRLLWLRRT
ncbi:unnamed protein product [Arctogadus glacialis]